MAKKIIMKKSKVAGKYINYQQTSCLMIPTINGCKENIQTIKLDSQVVISK